MMIRGPTIDGICRDMIKFGNCLFSYDTCQRQPLGARVSIVEPRRPVPLRNPDAVLPSLSAGQMAVIWNGWHSIKVGLTVPFCLGLNSTVRVVI